MELTPEISAQHLLLSPEALQDDGRLAGREFVRAPRPGEAESISLLMCAASAGNVGAVKMLLSRGVLPALSCCRWHNAKGEHIVEPESCCLQYMMHLHAARVYWLLDCRSTYLQN